MQPGSSEGSASQGVVVSSSFGSSSATLAVFAFLTFLAVPLCSRAAAESPEEQRKVAAPQVHPGGDSLELQRLASTQTFLGQNSFTLGCLDRIVGVTHNVQKGDSFYALAGHMTQRCAVTQTCELC